MPARAVERAAQWVHEGRRLEMQGLAQELGISRVTLFRHVGGREELLRDALCVLTERAMRTAELRGDAERPVGALRSPCTGRHFNAIVSQSYGLRRLLDDEPALTMRVLTDPHGPVQTAVVSWVEGVLRRDVEELGLAPLIDPANLAYALVRLGESFLYADVLAARTPDVTIADRLQEALIASCLTGSGAMEAGSARS